MTIPFLFWLGWLLWVLGYGWAGWPRAAGTPWFPFAGGIGLWVLLGLLGYAALGNPIKA